MTNIHAKVLINAQFYLKMSLEISKGSYSHSNKSPIDGTGQGAAHSPIVWALTSSVLFKIHQKLSYGMSILKGSFNTKFSITGFVGNANNYTTEQQADLLILKASHDAQRWADLLHVVGTKFNQDKSFYTPILQDFTNAGNP